MAAADHADQNDLLHALFEAHAGYVYASLRRLGVATRDLEDLTQDVFIAVHRALDNGYDASRPPKPWLFAFCYRVASNYRRLARHRVELVDRDAHDSLTPEQAVSAAQERSRLERALDVLSDDHRAVFVMHAIDGASGPEIAEALGIPLNTAYSRIRLAKRSVEASLRDLAGGEP
jgi:RNA polymerase sigma-70 factor, ECF subfamily